MSYYFILISSIIYYSFIFCQGAELKDIQRYVAQINSLFTTYVELETEISRLKSLTKYKTVSKSIRYKAHIESIDLAKLRNGIGRLYLKHTMHLLNGRSKAIQFIGTALAPFLSEDKQSFLNCLDVSLLKTITSHINSIHANTIDPFEKFLLLQGDDSSEIKEILYNHALLKQNSYKIVPYINALRAGIRFINDTRITNPTTNRAQMTNKTLLAYQQQLINFEEVLCKRIIVINPEPPLLISNIGAIIRSISPKDMIDSIDEIDATNDETVDETVDPVYPAYFIDENLSNDLESIITQKPTLSLEKLVACINDRLKTSTLKELPFVSEALLNHQLRE